MSLDYQVIPSPSSERVYIPVSPVRLESNANLLFNLHPKNLHLNSTDRQLDNGKCVVWLEI